MNDNRSGSSLSACLFCRPPCDGSMVERTAWGIRLLNSILRSAPCLRHIRGRLEDRTGVLRGCSPRFLLHGKFAIGEEAFVLCFFRSHSIFVRMLVSLCLVHYRDSIRYVEEIDRVVSCRYLYPSCYLFVCFICCIIGELLFFQLFVCLLLACFVS